MLMSKGHSPCSGHLLLLSAVCVLTLVTRAVPDVSNASATAIAVGLGPVRPFVETDYPNCRTAPSPPLPNRGRRQDSDGILRTSPCEDRYGDVCSICCDGVCCENVTGLDGSAPAEQHWIPLRVIVLGRTNTTYERLQTDGRLRQNVQTLNHFFAASNMWFYLQGIEWESDERSVGSCNTDPCLLPGIGDACSFMTYTLPRLGLNASVALPWIVCDADVISFYGEAQYPWKSPEEDPFHYIITQSNVIGVSGPGHATGLGHTMVHEVGHYFGLFHTFEGSVMECGGPNDWVDDTPAGHVPADTDTECDAEWDTCPNAPGFDAVRNFMNYARDECMSEFTPGQRSRMHASFRRYRSALWRGSAVPAGACPEAATTISECQCSNGASPEDRCVLPATQLGETHPPAPTTATQSAPTQDPAPAVNPPRVVSPRGQASEGEGSGTSGLDETAVAAIVGGIVFVAVIATTVACVVSAHRRRTNPALWSERRQPPPELGAKVDV